MSVHKQCSISHSCTMRSQFGKPSDRWLAFRRLSSAKLKEGPPRPAFLPSSNHVVIASEYLCGPGSLRSSGVETAFVSTYCQHERPDTAEMVLPLHSYLQHCVILSSTFHTIWQLNCLAKSPCESSTRRLRSRVSLG